MLDSAYSSFPLALKDLAGFLLRQADSLSINSFPAADTGRLLSSYVRAVECEPVYISRVNGWITEYSRHLEHSTNTMLNLNVCRLFASTCVLEMFLVFSVLTFVY